MRSLAALAAAAMIAATAAHSAETLRVDTECAYFQFNYRPDAGELSGYDADVAREIGARIGMEIDFFRQEWKGMSFWRCRCSTSAARRR